MTSQDVYQWIPTGIVAGIPPETPFVIFLGISPIIHPNNPPVIPQEISPGIPHGIRLAEPHRILC